jgi:2-methylcitrate dehydratase
MIEHRVRVYRSAEELPRAEQLAWKIAEVAGDPITRASPPRLSGVTP